MTIPSTPTKPKLSGAVLELIGNTPLVRLGRKNINRLVLLSQGLVRWPRLDGRRQAR